MNFNLDDPLADLLSDHSNENDSFFDNFKRGSKAAPAKTGRKMDDLFGIKEETTPKTPAPSKPSAADSRPTATSTPRITKQKPSQSKDDGDNDDDDDLGFDPKKPKAATKTNLFDDLLGPMETRRPATASAKPTISRQSTDTTTDNGPVRPKTSTGRRSSGFSGGLSADPLGLFTAPAKQGGPDANVSASGMSTPKTTATKRGTTADWLGLSLEPEPSVPSNTTPDPPRPETPRRSPPPTATAPEVKNSVDVPKAPDPVPQATPRLQSETWERPPVPQMATTVSGQQVLQMNTMNLESQSALAVLQQQESQLTLATQMRNQEQALLEMQRKQESLLQQQERQFSDLLQQQIQRQQQLEEHIRAQQQRINAHIQLMMAQPTVGAPFAPYTQPEVEEKKVESPSQAAGERQPLTEALEVVRLEADVKRLELEKLRLEELVESLKANYEKEIEMTEASFRKQLKVLEEHLAAVEGRLKGEIEEQHEFYAKKLAAQAEDRERMRADWEAGVAALRQDHEDEVRRLRKTHEDDLETVRDEHRRMLETIRQAKTLEFAALQDNGSYLATLRAASSNLAGVSDGLETLREEMQTKVETLNRETEQRLAARERRLEDAERRQRLAEEGAAEEKQRLMELVATLEVQLAQQAKGSADETWALRQKSAALEAERAAFEREKTLLREQLARDEQRVADLKEQQLAETQRLMLEVQDERARLQVERARIETGRRLHPSGGGGDAETQQREVEAALQVAQDATRQADAERARFHKRWRELEQQKRALVDRENALAAKEDELEQELQAMRLAERKSLETQQRASVAEQGFRAKVQFLQRRMRELGEREAQLSQEQLLLAQERIQLQNQRTRQAGGRRCTLCRMTERSDEIAQLLNTADGGTADEVAVAATSGPDVGAPGTIDKYRHLLSQQGNAVDRLLDENIAESWQRMRSTVGRPTDRWSESVLDDDSKELALYNLDPELQLLQGQGPTGTGTRL